MNRHFIQSLFIITLFCIDIHAQAIVIDEEYNDWDNTSYHIEDAGDHAGLEIVEFYIANDNNYLFFNIKFSNEINLQDANNIRLLVDCDNDPNTGNNFQGIGADLVYEFGNRTGLVNQNIIIDHSRIGLFSLPTVSSDQFEIAIDLDKLKSYTTIASEIKVYFHMNQIGGDIAPDPSELLNYTIKTNIPSDIEEIQLSKQNNEHIRVLSYNVLRDNIFDNTVSSNFTRILNTIDADIMCFQEVYDFDAEDLLQKLSILGVIDNANDWHAIKDGRDLITLSRFPISYHTEVWGNSVVEIQTDIKELVIFNCHLPCCDNDQGRVEEIDGILSFLNESLEEENALEIKNGTPYIFLGDMNLVGQASQVESLLTGDIIDNNSFGPDPRINYGDGPMQDSKPRTTNFPASFTWQDYTSSFPPGRLDYIIYTGSVIDLVNSFVLNTMKMSQSELNESGLEQNDTELASDHLPVVCDFSFGSSSLGQIDIKPQINIYPNPGTGLFTIEADQTMRTMEVYNESGVHIMRFDSMDSREMTLNMKNYIPGVYYLHIQTSDKNNHTKRFLVK